MRVFTGFVTIALLLGLSVRTDAATIFSTGEGSAVTTTDRSATFDTLTADGLDLSNYSEDGLSITVPDDSSIGFDAFGDGTTTAFHYGYIGNTAYVTIKGTDDAVFDAVEFKLGDGIGPTTATDLRWQALLNGVVVGSGFEASLAKGTIVGWSDSSGFDELRVAAGFFFTTAGDFGDYQFIALDNVNAQLASVPEPASVALLGMGLVTMGGRAWRRRRAVR